MQVTYSKHNQLDFCKWDKTITSSSTALPYAYSWYLDAVSPNWEALVADDYAFVMPLPVKQKWGIKYVIQPRWTQQLGIFSAQPITSAIIRQFLHKIPYLSYDFNLNYGNEYGTTKPNLVLDLQADYSAIKAKYATNTLRNLHKAQQASLTIKAIEKEQFIAFWRTQNADKPLELRQKLPLLATAAEQSGVAHFYGVFTTNGALVSALFTLELSQRIINLVPVSNEEGKQVSAMFLLIDSLLQREAGSGKIFDFEGSQITGVARFYEGFGAAPQNYYTTHRCRPQWLVKLLHR